MKIANILEEYLRKIAPEELTSFIPTIPNSLNLISKLIC